MKKRLVRGLAGLLAALIICVCPSSAGAESSDNAVETFYFARLGASADQAKSYRIIETARGRIIRIELFYSCYIVLPAADDDMDALYALIDALKLAEWNGFDETDPDALDGESFSLSVAFSDGYSGAGGDVTVPGALNDGTVDVIQSNAFSNMDAITSLTLPDTLLQLRDSAICWDENLTAVTLPDSLIAIGERNLYACPKLGEVTIPAGVRFIGEAAFSYDDSLRKIVFEGVCPVIESGCFTDLPEDAVIYVPDDQLDAYQSALTDAGCAAAIQTSGKNAVIVDNNGFDEADFDAATGTITKYNAYATYLAIPETIGGAPVKAIGDGAFEFHYYLSVLALPEGLEAIGAGTFESSYYISELYLPSTLQNVGSRAFADCALTYMAFDLFLRTQSQRSPVPQIFR